MLLDKVSILICLAERVPAIRVSCRGPVAREGAYSLRGAALKHRLQLNSFDNPTAVKTIHVPSSGSTLCRRPIDKVGSWFMLNMVEQYWLMIGGYTWLLRHEHP